MPWLVETPDGRTISTDDLTLDEVEVVEKLSGEPWALLNPLRSIRMARACLALGWIRDGWDADRINTQLDGMTVGDIRRRFVWLPDDPDLVPLAVVGKVPADSSPGSATSSATGSSRARRGDGRPTSSAVNE